MLYSENRFLESQESMISKLGKIVTPGLMPDCIIKDVFDAWIELNEDKVVSIFEIEDIRIEKMDADRFADFIRLKFSAFRHSWAGSDEIEETGWLISGDAKSGLESGTTYSNNGELEHSNHEVLYGDFSINQPQVYLVRRISNESFNREPHSDETWVLGIYLPD